MTKGAIVTGALTLLLGCDFVAAQTVGGGQRATPPPEGRRIEARDGDLIVVDHDARVRMVRRREAVARVIHNAAERWVVLLADFIPPGGRADGMVDFTYSWRQIEGTWPIEDRWDGTLFIEDYMSPGFAPNGIGVVLPQGRIQFLTGGPARDQGFADPKALAIISYGGGGGSMAGRMTFDQVEPRAVAEANGTSRSISLPNGATGQTTFVTSSTMTASMAGAPVRVGGSVAAPRKTHDAAAVYPEAMRQSGVGGVVILEVIVAADGNVRDVKMLRGVHPQLDAVAVDAVRQWRYEPTLLNGVPVPIVFTATVSLRP